MITAHKHDAINEQIEIEQIGKRGAGGAFAQYRIWSGEEHELYLAGELEFMSADNPSGLTNEALMAILLDRLVDFQEGPSPCEENNKAIAALQTAQEWLIERSRRIKEEQH